MSIQTKIISITNAQEGKHVIADAAAVLKQGGIVAFPTETVYGLGADALNTQAVQRVFQAKGRPSDNPLIVHLAGIDYIFMVASEVPEKGRLLAQAFWPGPMTLIVKKNPQVPDIVTAGLDTVAVRVPNHPVTLALLREMKSGIVGPSANTSGKPSPTSAMHVADDLRGKIEMILDAGETQIGVESTVIDVTVDPPMILRFGGLSREEIELAIGPIQTAAREESLKRSPGTRHRHYAPNAEVWLIAPGDSAALQVHFRDLIAQGKKVGVVLHSLQCPPDCLPEYCRLIGPGVQQVARQLFASLRALDQSQVDSILVESVLPTGLGAAVMDRLRKAAHYSKVEITNNHRTL